MRTPDEIIKRIHEIEDDDWFEWQKQELVMALPYEHAKEFLRDDVTKDDWKPFLSDDDIIRRMRKYMKTALYKAVNHKGLSASRSISYYLAWLWLLGDDEMVSFIDDDNNYAYYGVPILRKICEKYKFRFSHDNPHLVNMSQGLPCELHCSDCNYMPDDE